jgi:hypothetical protein
MAVLAVTEHVFASLGACGWLLMALCRSHLSFGRGIVDDDAEPSDEG